MLHLKKAELLAEVRRCIERDLTAMAASQRDTQAGATHEESRPENDKDTRALEASYLARGQARRVVELTQAKALLEAVVLRDFADDDAVAIGALVAVDVDDAERWYFVLPAGGGLKLRTAERTIAVVTPNSPLGRALLGQHQGDAFEYRTPQGMAACSVTHVG